MESTNGFVPDSPTSSTIDAAADLELLDRAKSVVTLDQFLDFGPWWYAPMLATTITGISLFGQAFDILGSSVIGVAAVAASCIVLLHDSRRRAVRTKPSMRGAAYTGIILVIVWMIAAAWSAASSSLGYERFVPNYAALGWVLTTVVLLVIRAVLMAIRRRQTPLQ